MSARTTEGTTPAAKRPKNAPVKVRARSASEVGTPFMKVVASGNATFWALTFEMSGKRKQAQPAVACPLDGRVRGHSHLVLEYSKAVKNGAFGGVY